MNHAMLSAACVSALVFLYAPSYTWFAICGQAGFMIGLFVGRVLKKPHA